MELSFLVAKIISVIYITSGIAVLIGTLDFNKLVDEFEKSPALTYFSGAFAIIIGMLLVHHHNSWTNNWTIIITIICWLFLIGGVLVVVIPKSLSFYKKYFKISRLWGLVMILFGLVIGYFGFII